MFLERAGGIPPFFVWSPMVATASLRGTIASVRLTLN